MDDGMRTDLLPIYIGKNRPDILLFSAGGLTTGLPYRFTAQAINENGYSEISIISTYYACRTPTYFATPFYIESSQDTKTI
jgi:hypothetical protein